MSETVEAVLQLQRQKTIFSVQKMRDFLYGAQMVERFKGVKADMAGQFSNDFNLFNEGRVQILKEGYRSLARNINIKSKVNIIVEEYFLGLALSLMHQLPGTVHIGMFIKCIELMGTDQQQSEYLEKCKTLEMFGCYAQTEIGHGSDVRSLQTTATFDQKTDQFIINTPSISAAKFWPGDMGISANHALVFAQLIIKGKNCGVQSFVVRIRDQNHNPVPGVQVGDIGPKIGFHAKDNGYLLMKNIRIPKKNMLRKFISVSKNGQIKKKGDPLVSYATMMSIRMYISCIYPKVYAPVITIATRYSMFRKQFKDHANQEIPVIQYQLQQQKIIPRVAEFYAMILAGNKVRELCTENFRRIIQKGDSSLMAETHAVLCCTKSYFSQVTFYGMEICRRACGGQGYSHYSGIPSIYYEYAANLTHEGEDTILYLQTARYILKSYKNSVTKEKPIDQSVKYIDSYDFLMGRKCEVDSNDPKKWTLEDIRILLAQAVCHLISVTTAKIMSKEESIQAKDHLSQNVGIRLQQLAIAHSCYFTYNAFKEAVLLLREEALRMVSMDLCMLYGINVLLTTDAAHLIEGNFLNSDHFGSLKKAREALLKKLRPHLIGLVDSFDLSEEMIRSQLAHGNPYQNYYLMAKKCSLNQGVQEAAIIVKDGIQEALKPKL